MPNLVYYKDDTGAINGPLDEKEATALFRSKFFTDNHSFRVVDADNGDDFVGIEYLKNRNGTNTPFGRARDPELVELVQVYKELSLSLKEKLRDRKYSNDLLTNYQVLYDAARIIEKDRDAQQNTLDHFKKVIIEDFEEAMKIPGCVELCVYHGIEDYCEWDDPEYLLRMELNNTSRFTIKAMYGKVWYNTWDSPAPIIRPPNKDNLKGDGAVEVGEPYYLFVAPHIPGDIDLENAHVHKFLCPSYGSNLKKTFPSA